MRKVCRKTVKGRCEKETETYWQGNTAIQMTERNKDVNTEKQGERRQDQERVK